MKIRRVFARAVLLVVTFGSQLTFANDAAPVGEYKQSSWLSSDAIEWGYLNPLRGDKSPAAANLWGDRTQNAATGMLVRFNRGFASPPHIHNISYRGVVIEGELHNDDPAAAKAWMPASSFWTQPAGENHITAANSDSNLVYLEIDAGPYLVKPSAEEFNNGEHALNLHQANMVWQSGKDVNFIASPQVQLTQLWGSPLLGKLGGTLLRIPAGYRGQLMANAAEFRAVVIKGAIEYQSNETGEPVSLNTGSYFSSVGEFTHNINTTTETLIYLRLKGSYEISDSSF
ncbi:DUF4437 domain-containing protein [Shewanella waksmanii]|uniref:DUF4437 domain-containing protein n=1 Tax=Shewanella waksmanii TaxID=213783 RepID=UPI00048F3A3C|nr:DUF4437 domain-containing protein [Shewanella waksmanii]